MTTKEKSKSSRKKKTLADKADKFLCYQKSVQSPDNEVEIFEQVFRENFGRAPSSLREDFCGTFAICCEWVKGGDDRTAIGVDLCAETLAWGMANNLAKLGDAQQQRVTVLQQDVRTVTPPCVDVVAAQNFSFWLFKTRPEVIEYFKTVRENLNDQGVFVMDMMGGGACYTEDVTEKRKIKKGKKGFSYHWEQATFNPVNADCSYYIHFRFADGSKMKRAFEYHWRLWTVPEVLEMLFEAGFGTAKTYWETEDEDGEDTGEWAVQTRVASNDSWLCYVVATP